MMFPGHMPIFIVAGSVNLAKDVTHKLLKTYRDDPEFLLYGSQIILTREDQIYGYNEATIYFGPCYWNNQVYQHESFHLWIKNYPRKKTIMGIDIQYYDAIQRVEYIQDRMY